MKKRILFISILFILVLVGCKAEIKEDDITESFFSMDQENKNAYTIVKDAAAEEFATKIFDFLEARNADSAFNETLRKIHIEDKDLAYSMEDIGNDDIVSYIHKDEGLALLKDNMGDLFFEDKDERLYCVKGSHSIYYLISVKDSIYSLWVFDGYLEEGQTLGDHHLH